MERRSSFAITLAFLSGSGTPKLSQMDCGVPKVGTPQLKVNYGVPIWNAEQQLQERHGVAMVAAMAAPVGAASHRVCCAPDSGHLCPCHGARAATSTPTVRSTMKQLGNAANSRQLFVFETKAFQPFRWRLIATQDNGQLERCSL